MSYSDDIPLIEAYNARRKPESKYRFQVHMGPELSAGDPTTASVVLLMNNPGFDRATSDPAEHTLAFDGWPLAGLHPDAPESLRDWYKRPFGELIRRYGAEYVSNRVAIVQLNPWASECFDSGLVLPSRDRQFELARSAARRGAVVVVGRSFRIWRDALPELPHHYSRNVRNPSLTAGCLSSEAWFTVQEAMK
jgi:hypothetical protein